ncbi:hypothetical protein [Natronocalculus amylovorans]|uniref:Uncharacterized protein n=1 Tax=Natronocalculus amylovorans TaxID=2917812 RepID=A0AAE3FWP5_9EURY|nr:hypothetical protein [Natronocalculus amylovorans]MCL9816631.1 hypothetical protein [Natronocalculus amylovorans]
MDVPSRRQLLHTIGGIAAISTAGCNSLREQPTIPPTDPDQTETETPTETPTPTERATPTPRPTECEISPIESEGIDVDEGFPFARVETTEVDTELFTLQARITRQFTEDRPALLTIRYTNKRSEPYDFIGGPTPPYSVYEGIHTELSDVGILAIPDTERDVTVQLPRRPEDGCWQAESELETEETRTQTTVDPCGTITRTYRLYATEYSERCLAIGPYQFETQQLEPDEAFALTIELLPSEA